MSKFFVGQRVRAAKADNPENIGLTGVITHIGWWQTGDRLPYSGYVMAKSRSHADVCCDWDSALAGGGLQFGPANSDYLEPIISEGAQPSEFSFGELMDNLRTKMQEEV